jgi:RNA polymerase sigma factor (TIGR02999 family)
MSELNDIFSQIDQGDPTAAAQLVPRVYDELKKMAAARLAHEKPGQTLSATDLVHFTYLRLVQDKSDSSWNGRHHFFGAAAEAMRRILVENARRKQSQKRGGNLRRQDADLDWIVQPEMAEDILEIDEALERLQDENPPIAKLVELKFFSGLTMEEAAAVLGVSERTARRYWTYAKAWLRNAIDGSKES